MYSSEHLNFEGIFLLLLGKKYLVLDRECINVHRKWNFIPHKHASQALQVLFRRPVYIAVDELRVAPRVPQHLHLQAQHLARQVLDAPVQRAVAVPGRAYLGDEVPLHLALSQPAARRRRTVPLHQVADDGRTLLRLEQPRAVPLASSLVVWRRAGVLRGGRRRRRRFLVQRHRRRPRPVGRCCWRGRPEDSARLVPAASQG